MARLLGVDLPQTKRIEIALTYIFGIGLKRSQYILNEMKIDKDVRAKDLTEAQVVKLRSHLAEYMLEGDLKRKIRQDIKRLGDVGCYRGIRHRKKLPLRGQRTHTNARTKRGKRIAVAGKKKVTK